jgi:AGZA family xanthine/uracil permease-like MFS transporter
MLIDRRWNAATIVFALCGLMTLFGVIHSPLPDGSMFWPWDIQGTMISRMVYEYSAGYLVVAVLIFFLGQWLAKKGDAGTKYDGVDEEPAGLELQS